jgi:hypothetical protein
VRLIFRHDLAMTVRTLLLVLLVVGCSSEPPAAPKSGGRGSATVTPPETTAPADAADAGDACAEIRRRFDAALATRTDRCSTAADCGCYNPVGGQHLGCGGVSDAATVAKLAEIEKEFHARRCTWTHQCGPWACAPQCVNQRCTL